MSSKAILKAAIQRVEVRRNLDERQARMEYGTFYTDRRPTEARAFAAIEREGQRNERPGRLGS